MHAGDDEAGNMRDIRQEVGACLVGDLADGLEIELAGVLHILAHDRTAVFLDARHPEEIRAQTLPSARSLPFSGVKPGKDVGEVKAAKDDGRLPMDDHNTRIIVFGRDGAQAKAVAEAVELRRCGVRVGS